MFKQAVKHEAKLRLAIAGPSGSGKTYTALAIATNLGSKVAVVDTEHGSASKYADIFSFDTAEMHSPFEPGKYIKAIQAAAEMGYDVLILDSMSHAWNGSGGMLEMVEQASKKFRGNSYAGWGEVTPLYQQMIEAIVSADLHIICTMRSKQDYVLIERNGKQVPQKVGMAPIQRDGFEYEFDVFIDMDIENNGIVQKTRCPALTGQVFSKPGKQVASILSEWLTGNPKPPKPRVSTNVPEVIQPDEVNLAARDDYEQRITTGPDNTDAIDESDEPEPEAKGRITDSRAWLEEKFKDGKTNLGMVVDAANMTGLYNDAAHAMNSLKEFDFPVGFSINRKQIMYGESALKVFDWLIDRKQ